jgi:hypothetical protein
MMNVRRRVLMMGRRGVDAFRTQKSKKVYEEDREENIG